MGDRSGIEWTEATWNPTRGCAIVSPGCTNCYAMKQAHRFAGPGGPYEGLTKLTRGGAVWTGEVRTVPELLEQPLRWRTPRRIFVDSMSDLFHEDVPEEFIDRVFAAMALSPQHTFQLLTKRPERMLDYIASRVKESELVWQHVNRLHMDRGGAWLESFEDFELPLPNVWLGVSVERQKEADERIPLLLDTPARVRFVSMEPLLGPVRLDRLTLVPQLGPIGKPNGRGGVHRAGVHLNALTGRFLESGVDFGARLDWSIVGGESGPGARPMHPEWARSLRDQCAAAGVPFFFKQWGDWAPAAVQPGGDLGGELRRGTVIHMHGEGNPEGFFRRGDAYVRRLGKKGAGRELDGRTHDEYPA